MAIKGLKLTNDKEGYFVNVGNDIVIVHTEPYNHEENYEHNDALLVDVQSDNPEVVVFEGNKSPRPNNHMHRITGATPDALQAIEEVRQYVWTLMDVCEIGHEHCQEGLEHFVTAEGKLWFTEGEMDEIRSCENDIGYFLSRFVTTVDYSEQEPVEIMRRSIATIVASQRDISFRDNVYPKFISRHDHVNSMDESVVPYVYVAVWELLFKQTDAVLAIDTFGFVRYKEVASFIEDRIISKLPRYFKKLITIDHTHRDNAVIFKTTGSSLTLCAKLNSDLIEVLSPDSLFIISNQEHGMDKIDFTGASTSISTIADFTAPNCLLTDFRNLTYN